MKFIRRWLILEMDVVCHRCTPCLVTSDFSGGGKGGHAPRAALWSGGILTVENMEL